MRRRCAPARSNPSARKDDPPFLVALATNRARKRASSSSTTLTLHPFPRAPRCAHRPRIAHDRSARAGGVPEGAARAADHHLGQDARRAQGPDGPLVGGPVRAPASVPGQTRHDAGRRRAARDPRRGHERQGEHVRVRGAHHAGVWRQDWAVHLAAPGGCPRAVPDRRRARLQSRLHARILVAFQRKPLAMRRPRGPARVLPVPHPAGFPDLRARKGGVCDPGGGPGRAPGRHEPRARARGVRRHFARAGPRGGARAHAARDRARESRDIQAARPRVHVAAAARGDGGVAAARG